jgi:hypothetical protein
MSSHPAIKASEITEGDSPSAPGAVRVLTGTDDSTYRERLVGLDDAHRALTYEILDSPLPVSGYRSTMRVWPIADTQAPSSPGTPPSTPPTATPPSRP